MVYIWHTYNVPVWQRYEFATIGRYVARMRILNQCWLVLRTLTSLKHNVFFAQKAYRKEMFTFFQSFALAVFCYFFHLIYFVLFYSFPLCILFPILEKCIKTACGISSALATSWPKHRLKLLLLLLLFSLHAEKSPLHWRIYVIDCYRRSYSWS